MWTWIEPIQKYIVSPEASVHANWLGLFLTIGGFLFTGYQTWRARKAAELAEQAARDASDAARRLHTIQDLSKAVTYFEEIKRLHSHQVWPALPDQYTKLRSLIVGVRAANPHLTDNHYTKLQEAITQLTSMESRVQQGIDGKLTTSDVIKLNKITMKQMDNLTEVLVEVRQGLPQ